MYVASQGHQHYGPGTSMVQRAKPGMFFGMGACCADCAKGGTCGSKGGFMGLGIFESGLDLSGWGWPEGLIAALGLYMIFSTFSTTSRGVGKVRAAGRKRTSNAKKRRDLEWRRTKAQRDLDAL